MQRKNVRVFFFVIVLEEKERYLQISEKIFPDEKK